MLIFTKSRVTMERLPQKGDGNKRLCITQNTYYLIQYLGYERDISSVSKIVTPKHTCHTLHIQDPNVNVKVEE